MQLSMFNMPEGGRGNMGLGGVLFGVKLLNPWDKISIEFKVSHQMENFKPSEVKNMCLHLTRLSLIVLLLTSERQWEGSVLFIKK